MPSKYFILFIFFILQLQVLILKNSQIGFKNSQVKMVIKMPLFKVFGMVNRYVKSLKGWLSCTDCNQFTGPAWRVSLQLVPAVLKLAQKGWEGCSLLI
jgi:hypothetical protein